MTPIQTHSGLAEEIIDSADTTAADDRELGKALYGDEESKNGWDKIIDQCLVEWGKDPSVLEDEGLIPPSSQVIDRACKIAMELRDAGWPPPTRVVPDGDGGISFEHRAKSWFQSLNVLSDGSVELLSFKDCRLVGRSAIQ